MLRIRFCIHIFFIMLTKDMGVVPFTVCAQIAGCILGCIVSDVSQWTVTCETSLIECKDRSGPFVACLWGGMQYGGNYYKI
jgi:hypothetical protein